MFFSLHVLGKKGPLAKLWLAAHWIKKLNRRQILEIDLKAHLDALKYPQTPLSLRTSCHLYVGVVNILKRQMNYLLQDCQEALCDLKILKQQKRKVTSRRQRTTVGIDLETDEEEDIDINIDPQFQEDIQEDSVVEPRRISTTDIRRITLPPEVASDLVESFAQFGEGEEEVFRIFRKSGYRGLQDLDRPIEEPGFQPTDFEDIPEDRGSVMDVDQKPEEDEEMQVDQEPPEITEAPLEITEEPLEMIEGPTEITERPIEITERPTEPSVPGLRETIEETLPSRIQLPTLDQSTIKKRKRRRRKTGTVFDRTTKLDKRQVKAQLDSTIDIVKPYLELGLNPRVGSGKAKDLFARPLRSIGLVLNELFGKNCISEEQPDDEMPPPSILLPPKPTRKRRSSSSLPSSPREPSPAPSIPRREQSPEITGPEITGLEITGSEMTGPEITGPEMTGPGLEEEEPLFAPSPIPGQALSEVAASEMSIGESKLMALYKAIQDYLEKNPLLYFTDLCYNYKRNKVAGQFFGLMVLYKKQVIKLDQSTQFGQIKITKGVYFGYFDEDFD